MDAIRNVGALLWQLAAGLLAMTVITLSPPLHGRMIVLPLDGGGGADALNVALRHGAGLVGRGPIPGSAIILGDFARLAPPLRAVGAILLAAPRGCGEVSK